MAERRHGTLQPTSLEIQFHRIWQILGGPDLVWQHTFYPGRRWRFDYAHLASKTAIELQGGLWQRGWHQNPVRYREDCEKLNAATATGWRIFWLTTDMLTDDPVGHVGPIITATAIR